MIYQRLDRAAGIAYNEHRKGAAGNGQPLKDVEVIAVLVRGCRRSLLFCAHKQGHDPDDNQRVCKQLTVCNHETAPLSGGKEEAAPYSEGRPHIQQRHKHNTTAYSKRQEKGASSPQSFPLFFPFRELTAVYSHLQENSQSIGIPIFCIHQFTAIYTKTIIRIPPTAP